MPAWTAGLGLAGWTLAAIGAAAALAVATSGVIAWRYRDRLPARSWPVRVWYVLTLGVPPRDDD